METLASSWALLLQSYTAVEVPVFRLDRQTVYVSSPKTYERKIEVCEIDHDDEGCTDLYISSRPESQGRPALTLCIDIDSSSCSLDASFEIPSEFLVHVAEQFMQILTTVADVQPHAAILRSPRLSALNHPPIMLDGPPTLHQLVSDVGQGAETAVEYCPLEGKPFRLSYAELDVQADKLCQSILECYRTTSSVLDCPVVPMLLPQQPDLYVSMLAILKAGGAFCPLGLDMPSDRIQFIVSDVDSKVILTTSALRARLSGLEETGAQILCVDKLPERKREKSYCTPPPARPESPAYVMYTSGSTGKPKGVPISHRAATQALLAHDPHIPKFKRFLQFASPTFDVSIFEIFFPLFRGATLVCSERERLLSDLPKVLRDLEIDAVELTPTVAGTLLQSRSNAPNLKALLTIGEMLTERVIEEFGGSTDSKDGILTALYGPTEATIHCTIDSHISRSSVVGNIGVPLSTVSAFILSYNGAKTADSGPEILPVGHIGELAVGGTQLSTGYLNRPEQTHDAFIELPGYGKLYRTGDKARLLPSGQLECLGRIVNTQVKLRGQRIELGEIEQTAYKVDGVDLVCASVIDGALVIFYSASSSIGVQDVKLACKKWLPRFMQPNDVVSVEDVPRLSSGKVDKKFLENDYRSKSTASDCDYESTIQQDLARIIGAELGINPSRCQLLTALGLDSIRAIRVASKLRLEGYSISVAELLNDGSIASIATAVEETRRSNQPKEPNGFSNMHDQLAASTFTQMKEFSATIEAIDLCTPIQQAMLSETLTDSVTNYNWFEVDIGLNVDAQEFIEAIEAVALTNDILRSGFVFVEELSTFARVIWKNLDSDCFSVVEDFNYDPTREPKLSLLWPVTCQVLKDSTKALFHIHHAIYDGWSLDYLVLDIEHVITGRPLPQRPSYRDVAHFYAEYTSTEAYSKDREYWKSALTSASPSRFPILCYRTINGPADVSLHHASDVTLQQMDTAAKSLGVSRPSLVIAAYAFLLGHYAGVVDPIFGVVSSGRTLPIAGVEQILGPCLTTLPMKVDLSQIRTVQDLVIHCHSMNREAMSHELLPLTEIKQLSGCLGDDQILESILVWQESLASTAAQCSRLSVARSQDRLKFALVLEIEPKADVLHFKLTFKPHIISTEQAQMMCKQLDVLLHAFINSYDRTLGNIVDAISHEKALISATNLDYTTMADSSVGLISNLETLALEKPQRTALEFVEDFDPLTDFIRVKRLSYSDLNGQAERLAEKLLGEGCRPNDLVPIWMEKSIHFYVSVLAVIKSGAGYLALDPTTPSARVRQILEDADAKLLLTTSTFSTSQELARNLDFVYVDRPLSKSTVQNLRRTASELSDVAYAVFTSGTTGKPKGLVVTRKNITSNIKELARLYPTIESGRLLQACSPAFDVSVFEIFFTWYQGMCLVAATNDILFRDYEALVQRTKVTHLSLTPSVAGILDRSRIPDVRFLVTAGEALTQKVFRDWGDGKRLYQGYGPAETTNICTVNPRMDTGDVINNIGPPLPNTSAFVIDENADFRILPRGFVGELCFGGEQVCKGYLKAPSLTAQQFIDHPTYGWLYRSGDMGRMLADGSLMSLGRKDDQVKVRGQRVELREIDHAILQNPHVSNCVTLIAKRDGDDQEYLVSFWTGPSDVMQSNADLTQMLSGVLPNYMVPGHIFYLRNLPTTVQGKIDKNALLQYFNSNCDTQRVKKNVPRSKLLSHQELHIANVVAQFCNVPMEQVDADTSFISIGVDSIKAIGLSRKLRDQGLGHVDVSAIFRHNTPARLATILSKTELANAASGPNNAAGFLDDDMQARVRVRCAEAGLRVQKILPCTPLQEMMLSESADASGAAYRNEVTMDVYGNIDKLRAAWEKVMRRHEILRACFVPIDMAQFAFAQIILEDFPLPWCSSEEQSKSSEESDVSITGAPRPPWRVYIQHSSDSGLPTMRVVMHHALYDADAFSILLRDIEAFYKEKQLPDAPLLDVYLQKVISARSPEVLTFWRSLLKGFKPISVVDGLQILQTSDDPYKTASRRTKITLSRLRSQSSAASLNIGSVFQAAWSRLLSCLLSTQDICFGNVYSGRDSPETESLVAPCFNTLPMRIELKHGMTNRQLAMALQSENLDILLHQASSLRLIQKDFRPQSRRLFDTLLLIQKPATDLNGAIWSWRSEHGIMAFPLILEVTPREKHDDICLSVHADASKLPEDMLSSILYIFEQVLENTVSFWGSQCLNFSFLTPQTPFFKEYSALPRGVPVKADVPHQPDSDNNNNLTDRALREVRKVVAGFFPGKVPEAIDPQGSIFKLGLDSINAFQISSQLKASGFTVSAADILEAVSVREIAVRALERVTDVPQDAALDIHKYNDTYRTSICQKLGVDESNVENLLPCTKAQNGILAQSLKSQGKAYLNRIEYETTLPREATLRAWRKLIAMHEMLRSGFVQIDTPVHPFSMLTYRPASFEVPLVREISEQAVTELVSSLHKGAWRMELTAKRVRLCMHHAIYDAQSLHLIFEELQSLSLDQRLPPQVPFIPFLAALLVADRESERSHTFWQSLSDAIRPCKFPDLHATTGHERNFSMISLQSSSTVSSMVEKCKDMGITLQVAGQAAWARILSAYTGESNVTFGVVLSTRSSQEDAERVVFPCVNTLPVPADASASISSLVETLSKHNAGLFRWPNTSLSNIQRWINIQEPLFDTVLVYQKLRGQDMNRSALEFKDDTARTEFALSIELVPKLDGYLDLQLTFDVGILPEAQAQLILEQYRESLLEITSPNCTASASEQSINEHLLSIMPPKVHHIDAPVVTLHGFVERTARQFPQRIAFEFVDKIDENPSSRRQWSYEQLETEGNKFADLLLSNGCAPGDLVGICFDKCPEASFAILGIMKAGCALVALDPGAPVSRKEFILRDAQCRILMTTFDKSSDLVHVADVITIVVDDPKTLKHAKKVPVALQREISSKDICYCLYTSGTTGNPKGCLISHGNAVQAMMAFQRLFAGHWEDDSRWLQFASFHFDVNILEHFWTWGVGMCLVSTPRDVLLENLAANINKLGITHIDLTPSLARLVTPDEAPSLSKGIFITGGEQLKKEVLEAWGNYEVIYNGYGPSEVTIGCTMHPRVDKFTKPSNIGPQFDNVGSYVLKPGTDMPVPRGAVGELCVTGPLVGIGYLNRPELTKERFPMLQNTGERMYRTGDLVRLLHDGSFDFLGRIDDQVKLRGQRLEIGEINEVIRQATPQVHDVVTLVHKHISQSKEQLISFVSLAKSSRNSPAETLFKRPQLQMVSEIRTAMASKLPPYMIPSFIVPLSRMPLSSNNKIEAKVLRSLFGNLTAEGLRAATTDSGVKGEVDEKIVSKIQDALAQTLDIEEESMDIGSSFFELGLDSITAITFARKLRQLGLKIESSAVMSHSTVRGLAAVVNNAVKGSETRGDDTTKAAKQHIRAFAHKHSLAVARSLGITRQAVEAVAPCTPLQAGMIAETIGSSTPVYHSTFRFALRQDVDLGRLKVAWAKARQHLQVLRTRFVPTEDGYAQVAIRPSDEDSFIWKLMTEEAGDLELHASSATWRTHSAAHLDHEPWAIHIHRSSESSQMLFSAFHGIYDGISLDLLLEYVQSLYNEPGLGQVNLNFYDVLPYGPLSDIAGAKEYWNDRQLPSTSLRLKRIPSSKPIATKSCMELSDKLTRCRNQLKVTEPAVFHAAWILTLFEHFRVVPIHGLIVSGRSIDVDGAEAVIGPMFNTLPCYIDVSPCETWADLVWSCHEFNTSVLPYQHTPLRDIMKWKKRNSTDAPFDSLFVFQKEGPMADSGGDLWKILDSTVSASFPIALEVELRRNGQVTFTLVTSTTSLTDDDAHQLLQELQSRVQILLEDSQRNLPVGMKSSEMLQELSKSPAKTFTDRYDRSPLSEDVLQVRKEVSVLAATEEDEISPDSSIFELGLDSIDAIKLSARLKECGLSVPMSQIMQSKTIRNIAARCTKTDEASKPVDTTFKEEEARSMLRNNGIEDAQFEKVLPTTPLQEGLISSMLESQFEQYYNHELLEVQPGVDLARLMSAWEVVVRNNGIFRTRFLEIDDPSSPTTYLQAVTPFSLLNRQVLHLEDRDLNHVIDVVARSTVSGGPDQPMFSVKPLQAGSKQYLLLSMSHALYDGTSLAMLHHDVVAAYNGEHHERPPYGDFVMQSLSQAGSNALEFWKDQLNGVKSTIFPVRSREALLDQTTRLEQRSSHSESVILKFCKSQGITVQTLGLTCWMIILAHRLKMLDVCSGIVLSGRSSKEVESIMFPTMNTVAFRCVIHGTVSELLQYVQDTASKISEYQHFPLRKTRVAAGVSEQLFNSIFLYQRSFSDTSDSEALYHSLGGSSSTEYPVNVEWQLVDGALMYRTACANSVLYSGETDMLLRDMDKVLSYMLHDPTTPVATFHQQVVEICGLSGFSSAEGSATRTTSMAEDPGDGVDINDVEQQLMNVIAKVAQVPKDTLTKNTGLFQIGLDSISAIKVSSLLRKESIRLPVSEMMKAVTIEKMARFAKPVVPVTSSNKQKSDGERPGMARFSGITQRINIVASELESILPATAGQEYMLQLWRSSSKELFYPAFFYQMEGEITRKEFEAAWAEVCKMMPALRTLFLSTGEGDDKFLQVILRNVNNPVRWLDDTRSDNPGAAILPPVRLSAIPGRGHLLLRLQLHHAIYDAVSLPLIISALERLSRDGKQILDINTDSSSYALACNNASAINENREFWSQYLQNISYASPSDAPSPPHRIGRTEVYQPGLVSSLDPISSQCRRAGVSIQSLFFAIYAQAATKHTQIDKIQAAQEMAIGIYLANRSHDDVEDLSNLAAPTMNIVPLKINPERLVPQSQSTELFNMARKIQADLTLISQLPHSAVSLRQIYDWTHVCLNQTVNFLKLPAPESEGPISSPSKQNNRTATGIHLQTIDKKTFESSNGYGEANLNARAGDLPSPLPWEPEIARGERERAYTIGIDVEASVRSGALDVGIFAPSHILDERSARAILEEIRKSFEDIAATDAP